MVLFLTISTTGFGLTTSDLDKNSKEIVIDVGQSMQKVVALQVDDQSIEKALAEKELKMVLSENDSFNYFLNSENAILFKNTIVQKLFERSVFKPNHCKNYNYFNHNFVNKNFSFPRDKLSWYI